MDYKIVLLLAMAATCALCIPSQPSCPCGRMYFPVCASDWQTSNNMCEYECRADHLSRYGQKLTIKKVGVTCEELGEKPHKPKEEVNFKPYEPYVPYTYA